ncbi:hypothetical protein PR048_000474 [Dryococelus australis]|uniref:Uncharacterized protein n=1 Tax=Dryococelus australis TaxID=614101 RepID=A0ABQ9IFX3_9NEOP|nr:hypothetical protein PR048_000474 [Dryococelus australis]
MTQEYSGETGRRLGPPQGSARVTETSAWQSMTIYIYCRGPAAPVFDGDHLAECERANSFSRVSQLLRGMTLDFEKIRRSFDIQLTALINIMYRNICVVWFKPLLDNTHRTHNREVNIEEVVSCELNFPVELLQREKLHLNIEENTSHDQQTRTNRIATCIALHNKNRTCSIFSFRARCALHTNLCEKFSCKVGISRKFGTHLASCDPCLTVSLLAPPPSNHQGDSGSIPGRAIPDFRLWESCWTIPLVGGISRESPFYPSPSFQRYSIFTSITHIGSEDLQNLSIPLMDLLRKLDAKTYLLRCERARRDQHSSVQSDEREHDCTFRQFPEIRVMQVEPATEQVQSHRTVGESLGEDYEHWDREVGVDQITHVAQSIVQSPEGAYLGPRTRRAFLVRYRGGWSDGVPPDSGTLREIAH